MQFFFIVFSSSLKSQILRSVQDAMAYQEFIHRLELGFQTLRVDFERKLMILVELYSGLNHVFETITGHFPRALTAPRKQRRLYWSVQNAHVPDSLGVALTSARIHHGERYG